MDKDSHKQFLSSEFGKHVMSNIQKMREGQIAKAENESDPMTSAFLLQQAKGVKMVIEYFNTMSNITGRKQ